MARIEAGEELKDIGESQVMSYMLGKDTPATTWVPQVQCPLSLSLSLSSLFSLLSSLSPL